MASSALHVLKRNGIAQNVMFDKITSRISKLCYGLSRDYVDPAVITMKVASGLFPGISTVQLDNLAAEIAASMAIRHPDYGTLASRIAVSNLHKETEKSFSKMVDQVYHSTTDGIRLRVISERFHSIVMDNADRIDSSILHDRDYLFTYFGLKKLEESYLLKVNDKIVERPQHMLMRVAISIHGEDIDAAIETYKLMSEHWFIFSTTTLYNAGSSKGQLASSYFLTMSEDSIIGIYDTLARCAEISKDNAGVGLNIHCIRSKGSIIAGTNGESTGIVPMLRVYNSSVKYSQQISNKRFGAICVYLEPWHPDIFEFVELKRRYGAEELRARDLSYALWVPDLFMERVEADQPWTLMCPNDCPGLSEAYGDEFRKLYEKYEADGRGRKVVSAQKLWYVIVESQMETGSPSMVFKDACNRRSNQRNVGTIKSLDLCTALTQYSSPEEIGACSVASINLKKLVRPNENGSLYFDFDMLAKVTHAVVNSLNCLIDQNNYSLPESRLSALKHRPIAISVLGLAEVFALLGYPFDSDSARLLNREIFEGLYYAAVRRSCDLAKQYGYYETFNNSLSSKGIFQFDMCESKLCGRWDWDDLRSDVVSYGLRNSILIGLTPTASTSRILSTNESVDPFVSNLCMGKMNSEEFCLINSILITDLMKHGCWNEQIKQRIISNDGSVQDIKEIPENLRLIYRTAWEIPQRAIIDMAAERAAFIDQSQAIKIHMNQPNYRKVSSMHFYCWKKGLKTGMYCLKTRV